MDRSTKTVLRKIIIDFTCLIIVALAVLMFFLFGKPYKRGFFCNDETLYHPFHTSTVTSAMLYVIGLFLPICTGDRLKRQCLFCLGSAVTAKHDVQINAVTAGKTTNSRRGTTRGYGILCRIKLRGVLRISTVSQPV